jgi:hypothetical protein
MQATRAGCGGYNPAKMQSKAVFDTTAATAESAGGKGVDKTITAAVGRVVVPPAAYPAARGGQGGCSLFCGMCDYWARVVTTTPPHSAEKAKFSTLPFRVVVPPRLTAEKGKKGQKRRFFGRVVNAATKAAKRQTAERAAGGSLRAGSTCAVGGAATPNAGGNLCSQMAAGWQIRPPTESSAGGCRLRPTLPAEQRSAAGQKAGRRGAGRRAR